MSEHLIYKSMIGVLTDVDHIGKNNKADMGNGGKYNFRGIDDMYNSLHSLFVKHQVFLIPKVLETTLEIQEKEKVYNGQTTRSLQYSSIVKMEFTFTAIDGSSVTATGIGHAIDTSDKGTNKAQSSALKYCLMQTFLIPTVEDKDVEKENNQMAKAKKQEEENNQMAKAKKQEEAKNQMAKAKKQEEAKNQIINQANLLVTKIDKNEKLQKDKTQVWLNAYKAYIPTDLIAKIEAFLTKVEEVKVEETALLEDKRPLTEV